MGKDTSAELIDSDVFDFQYFGTHLRAARRKKGFNSAEQFCSTVSRWTHVKISKEALYRIESGTQAPTLEQFIAFALILFHGDGAQKAFQHMGIEECLTPYSGYLADNQSMLNYIFTSRAEYFDEVNDHYDVLQPDEYGWKYIREDVREELYPGYKPPCIEC